MSAFGAALRISRRDALRFKARSALVMVMIGLPVFLITGLMTSYETANLSTREALPARLGTADAKISTTLSHAQIWQAASSDATAYSDSERSPVPWTTEQIAALVPGGRLITYDTGRVDVRLHAKREQLDGLELDLRDPMTNGIRRLVQGRLPAAPGEVAITPALLEELEGKVRLGDPLPTLTLERQPRVVGVVEHPNQPSALEVVALRGTVLLDKRDGEGTGWLVDTPAPMSWSEVMRLNESGLRAHSRAVIENPPETTPYEQRFGALFEGQVVSDLIVVGAGTIMIVLETVLLAGPAFAVGLRRRRRELAVIAAHGGSAAHLRMIVLTDGLVLGGTAAVLGTVLGIAGGLGGVQLLANFTGTIGPAEVPWPRVLGVAALGLASGLIAALAPAVQAARQVPAQVLAGRETAVRDRAGLPVLGLLLVVAGLAATALAVRQESLLILAALVLVLLGLVALMPWMVRRTGSLAGRLPLPLRLAVRDAVRHRGRTSSAVAAVMAATTVVIAMGLGTYSGYADREAHYRTPLPHGSVWVGAVGADDRGWATLRTAVTAMVPGAKPVTGFAARNAQGHGVSFTIPESFDGPHQQASAYYPMTDVPVGDARLLEYLLGRRDPQAAAALAAGKAVVFQPEVVRDGKVTVDALLRGFERSTPLQVPAVVVKPSDPRLIGGVLPASAATKAGFTLVERYLYAAHLPADEVSFERGIVAVSERASVRVEIGYQDDVMTAMLVFLGAAVVLVLGGTFAATGLAAADMRRDLDTMSAVGAAPATRKLVVAGQAGYIAGLGALIGLVAGVVTGIALSLRSAGFSGGDELAEGGLTLDPGLTWLTFPWSFMAAVVLGLPLLATLVAGVFARTRMTPARRIT